VYGSGRQGQVVGSRGKRVTRRGFGVEGETEGGCLGFLPAEGRTEADSTELRDRRLSHTNAKVNSRKDLSISSLC